MARSRELQDRHGGQPALAPHPQMHPHAGQSAQPQGRGVFGRQQAASDQGPALPWQGQDPGQAQQPAAYPDPAHGYYQHDPHAYAQAQAQAQQQAQQGYYANDPYGQQAASDAYYGHYFQQGQQPPQPPAHANYHPAPQPQQGYPQQGYADPRAGYDLGNYNTQPPRTQPPSQQAFPPPPAQQGYDAGAYAQEQGQPHDADHDDDEYYDEEPIEEPKSRFRSLLVVGSLVAAIALGAGLAYGYKKFGGGLGGKPPVLKADAGQTKVRADGAEGRKVAERLDGPAPAVVPAKAPDAPANGPRVVQTIPVAPNGTLISQPPSAAPAVPPSPTPPQQVAAAAPPSAPLRPTISVPGMAVDNLPPTGPVPPAAAQPQVISAPAGRAVAPPPAPAQPAVIASAPAEKAPVQKTAKAASAVAAPAAAPAAAPKASNGYVAVLSSQGSRIEALKAYADLQQKYNSVLGGKPADVQEATVNGKVWYRAVVGPPGSRTSAADLCAQLKTAGHSACFPAAY